MHQARFSPFGQMDSLRRQIDQVFAGIEATEQNSHLAWSPAIELLDKTDHLILRMQLAGIDDKDIDIQVTSKSVTISGERHRPEENSHRYLHSEFNYGKFQRKISLPVPVISSQATAKSKAGMLTLILPKIEEDQRRIIRIKLGETTSASPLPETASVADSAVACS